MAADRSRLAAALKYLGDKADLRGRYERSTSLDPQEQDLADIVVETGASFIPGVGQALAARDVERARRANDPAGMAMASMGAIPGGRLAKLLKGFDPTRLELDVYHGTPHRFSATEANPLGEFDASKIGTGEGAQAYGHGVYLAEAPEVAEGYKKTISQSMTSGAQRRLKDAGGDLDKAIADTEAKAAKYRQGGANSYAEVAEEDLRGLRQFKEAGEWTKGSLYKADLPDEMIDRMLDWDKPIKDQPAALQSIRATLPDDVKKDFDANAQGGISGGNAYLNWVWGAKSAAQKSDKLKAAGIPGIKYSDAGSRGKGGSGTRNFVVFPGEEKKVRILKRK